MRFQPIMLAAAGPLFGAIFLGCGSPDYGMKQVGDAGESAGDSDPSELPEDGHEDDDFDDGAEDEETIEEENDTIEETEEEDEELTDPSDCGFSVYEGFDQYEEPWSLATFSLVGDPEIEIEPGEPAKLQMAVTAHSCGDVSMWGMTVVMSVMDYEPADWVTRVEEAGVDSTMEHLTGEAEFEPIDGYNCNEACYDSGLFFEWDVDPNNPNITGGMDEVYVSAGTTEILEFTLVPTDEIEPGTQLKLYLIDPIWYDEETGSEVYDTYYFWPSTSSDGTVMTTVTVIEPAD